MGVQADRRIAIKRIGTYHEACPAQLVDATIDRKPADAAAIDWWERGAPRRRRDDSA